MWVGFSDEIYRFVEVKRLGFRFGFHATFVDVPAARLEGQA